uniref:Tubulin-specific chaperone E n=1 Tax=Syphacia muris TaxID=451379 RepID=A0A0N5AEQ6_9BILA
MELGCRVDVNGNRGTVKYIGLIDGHQGNWVGIEWDDCNRGKHDGSVAGKRYFVANGGPRSSSFVRVENVIFGRRIDEEMLDRYAVKTEMDYCKFGTEVDFVAMEETYGKQRDIYKLRCVLLDNMYVSFAPNPGSPHFLYCEDFRRNYMEPRLGSLQGLEVVQAPVFHLVVNDCKIDHQTVFGILRFFPQLEYLYIGFNGINRFECSTIKCNLQLLDLEGNQIEDMSHISSLCAVESLTSLNLSNCGLKNIHFDFPVGYVGLKELYIRNNCLSGWDWIDEVAKLPALIKLYVKGTVSLDEEFGQNTRECIIAKLQRLQELDRCEISHIERRSAEILFLDKYGVGNIAPQHQKDIERLKAIYGTSDQSQQPQLKSGMHLLKLKLEFNGKEISCSLPVSTYVQKLYGMASRLFHLDVRKMKLCAENSDGKLSLQFDNPLRSLDFYDLADGDIIHISKT